MRNCTTNDGVFSIENTHAYFGMSMCRYLAGAGRNDGFCVENDESFIIQWWILHWKWWILHWKWRVSRREQRTIWRSVPPYFHIKMTIFDWFSIEKWWVSIQTVEKSMKSRWKIDEKSMIFRWKVDGLARCTSAMARHRWIYCITVGFKY